MLRFFAIPQALVRERFQKGNGDEVRHSSLQIPGISEAKRSERQIPL
jgi:hypothetical protein